MAPIIELDAFDFVCDDSLESIFAMSELMLFSFSLTLD